MLGAVNSSSVSVGLPGLGSRWLDPSFWAQDDYKINPKLTVNLGVRWDILPAIHEVHNIFTWLNPAPDQLHHRQQGYAGVCRRQVGPMATMPACTIPSPTS